MGRKKAFKPYEGKSTDNFIRLTNSMLKSPLYLSLSGGALKVYSLMKLMGQ
ncbi:MAG: hypothetical protein J6M02_02705 [Clostridia bacterium]|nr:hypothetical protein [Clostridia bacterium]